MKKKGPKNSPSVFERLPDELTHKLLRNSLEKIPPRLKQDLLTIVLGPTHAPPASHGIDDPAQPSRELNHEFIAAYLEGHVRLSPSLMTSFLEETETAREKNTSLHRLLYNHREKYKKLLNYCLDRNPLNRSLLHCLADLHAYLPMLSTLVSRYQAACGQEPDLNMFLKLTEDYDYNTAKAGFDALYDLTQRFAFNSPKRVLVERLMSERQAAVEAVDELSPEDLSFP